MKTLFPLILVIMLVFALVGCSGYEGDSRFSGRWILQDYEGSGNAPFLNFSGTNYRFSGSRDPNHPLVELISDIHRTGNRTIIQMPNSNGTYTTNDDNVIELVMKYNMGGNVQRRILGSFQITENTLTITFEFDPTTSWRFIRQ